MSGTTTLQAMDIQIGTTTTAAIMNLTQLESTITKLQKKLTANFDTTGFSTGMRDIRSAIDNFKPRSLTQFESAVASLSKLSNSLKKFSIPAGFSSGMTQVSNAFNTLGKMNNTGSFGNLVNAFNRLGKIDFSTINAGAISSTMSSLSTAFQSVGSLSSSGGFETLISAMTRLSKIDFKAIDGTAIAASLQPLSAAFQDLGTVANIGGFNELLTALNRLPNTAKKLASVNFSTLTSNLTQLATSLNALGTVSPAAVSALNGLGAAGSNLRTGMSLTGGGAINLWAKLRMVYVTVTAVARAMSDMIYSSMEYEEDLNLFTVAMGDYAEAAQEYAEEVSEVMGIDPADWMRNQGVFNTLITGFGVASDRAATMSQNLTQLGYDIASFYNIDVSEAMTKIQSGISGELEPLRRLGYDLSQAKLSSIALSLGIKKSFTEMTQAEKAQLRYHAIMTQVTQAQGDMARTLESPSNQLRILKAQLSQAARAIGNIFIPALNAILPVAITVIKAIRTLANSIANLFGYSLTEVDYSGLDSTTESVDDLDDSLSSAGGSAQKLKDALMGFDEINKLPDFSSSGGGGGSATSTIDDWDWELESYNFLGNLVESLQGDITWVEDHANTILSIVGAIGTTLLTWKLASGFAGGLTELVSPLTNFMNVLKLGTVLTLSTVLNLALDEAYLKSDDDSALLFVGGAVAEGAMTGISALLSKKLFGNAAAGAGAALSLDAITDIVAIIGDVKTDGLKTKQIYTGIKAAISAGLGVWSLGKAFGLAGATSLLAGGIGVAVAIGVTAIATSLAYKSYKRDQMIADCFGSTDFSDDVDAIEEYANSKLAIDAEVKINNLTAAFSDKKSAQDSIDLLMSSLQLTTKQVKAGIELDAESAEAFKNSVIGEDGLISEVNSLLETSANEMKAFVSLVPTVGTNGEDNSVDHISFITSAQSLLEGGLSDMGNYLGNLISKGIAEGFSEETANTISSLLNDINTIQFALTQATTLSESGIDLSVSLEELSGDTLNAVYTEWQSNLAEAQSLAEQQTAQYKQQLEGQATSLAIMRDFYANTMNDSETAALYQSKIDEFENILSDTDWAKMTSDFVESMIPEGTAEAFVAAYRSAFNEYMPQAFSERDYTQFYEMLNEGILGRMSHTDTLDIVKGYYETMLERALNDLEVPESMRENFSIFGVLNEGLLPYENVFDRLYESGVKAFEVADALGITVRQLRSLTNSPWNITMKVTATADTLATRVVTAVADTGTVSNKLKLTSETFDTRKIRAYASGGYPKSGSLFWANENGAELVGTIGGKTAVANQQEIGDAIYSYMEDGNSGLDTNKLATAMVGALKAAGVGAVYLDGKQLASSINRETRRVGHSAIKI